MVPRYIRRPILYYESILLSYGILNIQCDLRCVLPFSSVMFPSPTLYTNGPVKSIVRADGLVQHAQVLYEQHKSWMDPDDRILAEDRMTLRISSCPASDS
jgi:hypothetical protein